ncbi:MAG: hypothetical protein GKR89_13835 [Candidatus Latescibacteria bacterium]|nr:hypothetical protein [Candidatus Latescibacterota bacterium]
MALEMLDVNSMDTGRYRAIVIQDATDKQGVKGFLKMAHVISARSIAAGTVGGANLNLRSIDGLCDVLNEYTGLQASFIGTITYDDERMLEIPIIIPQGAPNESELEHLARYMLAGGFIMGGYWREALVKYGGLVEGQDFWTERLSDGHPIFSAFFDLKSGLGGGGGGAWRDIVTGYFIHGRLAGITGVGWGANIRSNQMAVNIVVYALTQEGSITQRLMQMVN